ncbi:hypothetical protein TBLA_0A03540 [Henningerozyma blattae CBS 6284]|uniref:Non-specific serine/threonine protein kinase n=1 Tax=Henningerozyma blattae (strain ATCC 34711 / CBS 6284 / DSM 70876 / NBRC 10599 / NRRL Y-10934 / UCD 77-7) TaxID=1071380 RepID=I2GVK1_HENB6|nr:hypothetical protein TBLA_0A03540 [Tetrapisispora blattae CBS 6284]CCH58153.1 hypothetical protein TBLA_0A03540 [Tetrapisispora blattae CBS 6284]
MALGEEIDQFVSRFKNAESNLETKCNILSESYDIMELLESSDDYDNFLKTFIPLLLEELKVNNISFDVTSYEHKLRNSILVLLEKCIMNQVFEPYVQPILEVLLDILPRENEANGVFCIKILTALYRSYKSSLQDKVESLIQIIIQIYKNIPELMRQIFEMNIESLNSTLPNVDLKDGTNPLTSSQDDSEINALLMGNQIDENLLDDYSNNEKIESALKQENEKQTSTQQLTDETNSSKILRSSLLSFKTLSECPITMVTLYSSYKQLSGTSLPQFAPLVINLLNMQVEQQKDARLLAETQGKKFISVSPDIKNREAYCEFIVAQIKAISFLAYVFIRGYASDFLQNYVNYVPDLIIRLLQDCPPELSSARKELLHATRHILSTKYKKLFLPKLEFLFDQDVLIGKGFTTYETLRPLAYSTVADFIHNVRTELLLDDIEKTIKLYSSYLLDPTLALTVQIMSAKLLLNLVERILKLGKEKQQEAPRAKKLLMTIIDAYTNRCKMLNRQFDSIMSDHEAYEKKKAEKTLKFQKTLVHDEEESNKFIEDILEIKNPNNSKTQEVKKAGFAISDDDKEKSQGIPLNSASSPDNQSNPDENSSVAGSLTSKIKSTSEGSEKTDSNETPNESKHNIAIFELKNFYPILITPVPTGDPIKDAFYLYRTLMSFLKTIIHDLKVFNPPPDDYTLNHPKLWASISRVFSYEEVLVFKKLFHECILGLRFFASHDNKSTELNKKHFDITMPSLPVSATKDGRELMDYLAFMFMQMDSSTFNEIIESEIDFMYESMLNDSALLYIAQSFLTSEITSPNFASILLRFLVSKLKQLGNVNLNQSNILIRLFKLSFMSVNLFPTVNELVLLPHLNDLILNSLKYSTTADEPLVYFYLIRTLFRSIGGGRFENLYRSIKPILHVLLESLNRMMLTARLPHERELYVELCITVPVRLSVLAPYLPYLMKPLGFALQGYPDLISQGLRTLELCIDNLTAEYFDPIIEPVVEGVMKSLFALLKPQPFNHTISHTTARILGKLGGRNRKFLKYSSDLNVKNELDVELNSLIKVNGLIDPLTLSITPGIDSALNLLEDFKTDVSLKKDAFKYINSILRLMVKTSINFPENYSAILASALKEISKEKIETEDNFEMEKDIVKRDFSNQEKLFTRLLEAIFHSTSVPELQSEATEFIEKLLNHFCLLQVNNTLIHRRNNGGNFNIDLKQPEVMINPTILIEAISYSLSSYHSSVRETGIMAIKKIFKLSELIYTDELIYKYSFINDLLRSFIHSCFEEEFYYKRAGILGLKTLIEDISLPISVLKMFQFELVDAFLFVLKDLPSEAPTNIKNLSEKLLLLTLRTTCKDMKEEDLSDKTIQITFTDIVCELSNSNSNVRLACQQCLLIISEETNIPIIKLMDHSKNFLLSPIFAKPLRALPFAMQIGNMDAIYFCLTLPNTFLKFDDELFRLLQEAIVLADAEDESLSTIQKATEYRTSEQLIELRVTCIKLLALALKNEEFATSQQGNMRIRILAVFFKSMLKTSPEIIQTTYQALKDVLAENSRLPKELLQNGLKPMLMNLSDHQKLTVPGLDSLSKLLELLIAYFKVEIGRKLLDHLTAWCRIEVLDTLFGQDIEDQTPTKIIVSIINIFHLLPAQADMFLNDLLLKVMLLERKLRLQLDSPFRTPLAKFLNRFNTAVITYCKKSMALRQLVIFMCNIIQKPEAKQLADDFNNELDNFYDYYMLNIPTNQVRVVSFFANMVDLVNTQFKIRGDDWLKTKKDLVFKLKDMMKLTLTTIKENTFCIDNLQLSHAIEKYEQLYISFMNLHLDDRYLLFDFINFAYSNDTLISPDFHSFIYDNIIAAEYITSQNEYLTNAVNYVLSHPCDKSTVFVLHNIINNTLLYVGTKNNSLDVYFVNNSKPEWLLVISKSIWKNSIESIFHENSTDNDVLRFELLQLTSILTKWNSELLKDTKKDIVKFTWQFIKSDDVLIKQSAYLATSLLITKYEFPIEVITQVFVAILRCTQAEARHLVKQSLDTLAPVINNRMEKVGNSKKWIKWIKRVMFENNSLQNNTLYQFIINHKDLFYDSRDLFIPNIIHHMNKLTLMSNPTTDHHLLAVDLASLILYWEEKYQETEYPNAKDEDGDIVMAETTDGEATTSIAKEKGLIPHPIVPMYLRETCITFLIRFVCASNHRASATELGLRSLNILSTLVSDKYWSNVHVKLIYFEKFLNHQDFGSEAIVFYCLNALDVLFVFFRNRTSDWILENLTAIQNLLDKCFRTDHQDIQGALQKVLLIILNAIKVKGISIESEEETPSKTFIQYLSSVISQDLQGNNSIAAGVKLLWSLFMVFPNNLDSLLGAAMRTFSKLCKDHLSMAQPKDAITLEEARITTKMLEKMLLLLSAKISALGDSRRPFLSTVALLIDRSMDQNFLRKIVCISRKWVFNNEIFPTVKEKAAILTKMLAFEVRGEPSLSFMFYEIILDLFGQNNFVNSEITVRMEQPFLMGTRVQDTSLRKKFMTILDNSLERDIKERLYYIFRDQNWEYITDYPWLNQALQLLYGAFDKNQSLSIVNTFKLSSPTLLSEFLNADIIDTQAEETPLSAFVKAHISSVNIDYKVTVTDITQPLISIFYNNPECIRKAWVNTFPQVYTCIPKNEKYGFTRSIISLLSKNFHAKQTSSRTNVISILLDSISYIEDLELPPHLIKYLAISYNAWYQSINLLESSQLNTSIDNSKIMEANEDALLELYVNLQEEDMFYGLWRRKAKYTETNVALSFEQIGLYDKALQLYEVAQVKARSGSLPYSDSEYALWEDNWILCAEKLQHWDILTELAKHEGFTDLLLECGWRVADWNADREALEQSVKSVMDVPTPRRQMFETFLALQNFAVTRKGDQEVRKLCDEGIQLSLHKWCSLPQRFTPAHKWLLHGFQQYIEFLEATQMYNNLHTTTIQNLDGKAQEVKRVLQSWRDRLPNIWDDVNMWNDLVTWRQHTFQVINNSYLPLVPALQQGNSSNNINTHAYRGYHEIAWVINRFAHVARRHNMPEVCISQLARIYTLPNIEIQEAFLKLREQAKCHYQNMNELTTGLDVISNTNLVYFGTVQKAEFFTLKGMFLSKLRAYDEANQAFATAVQIDLNLAKAWAQWGFFNDRRLSDEPNNISFASNTISCYLQAAGLYKNSKTRRLLCRILWLISMDDGTNAIANAFDSFRGEVPVWYWITYIPQLLTSLSHKEANMVRQILIRIAKTYPQALHFQLRTTKEDFAVIQRQTMAVIGENNENSEQNNSKANSTRQPWEHLQELNNILKTAYPLLALSLESLVAQINDKFKTSTDEDLFRLINVLLIDATYNYNHLPLPRGNPDLPSNTVSNLIRFSETLLSPHIRPKFNVDFIEGKPNFETYIKRLRYWRRRLENKLDRLPKIEFLEKLCPHLSNFHHQKFEEIEIPGQYLLNKDSNAHFIRIARFLPKVTFVRGTHSSYRRLLMRGHDGSMHAFAVQYPAVRHSRREERMFQLYRLLNESLSKYVETRRRNINFTLPIAVPLSPQVRVMNDSASFTSLHQIYDDFCSKQGIDPCNIQDFVHEQLNVAFDKALPHPDLTVVKVEIFSSIQSIFVPSGVLKDYFSSFYTHFEDFWLFRKQFASHYGTFIFMTYMMMINNRTPHKIHIDVNSGDVFTLEMLPSRYPYERVKPLIKNQELKLAPDAPIFHNNEPVPFRLTPNIQKLIGDSALEGILSVDIFAISQALVEPDNELNTYLTLFIRDEIISWFSNLHRPIIENPQLREMVQINVDLIIRKVMQLGHLSSTPAVTTQFILDCISSAVNPRNLAKTDVTYIPWF